MDRYWRIGGMFNSLRFISRHYYDKAVVGFILHKSHDGAMDRFKKMWKEMKKLIPKEYYKDYELLKIKMSGSYPVFIIFDEPYQGEAFIKFVWEHFNDGCLAVASMWVDGKFEIEST